jgi:Flp pilus assembly protein TadB
MTLPKVARNSWNLGPVILCVDTLILFMTGMARSVGKPGAVLPFTTLAVIWLVAVFVLRSRHQRELKQELDQLNQIERSGIMRLLLHGSTPLLETLESTSYATQGWTAQTCTRATAPGCSSSTSSSSLRDRSCR